MNDGISFMVRIRNEEQTLEKSIRSLFKLTIPHEINLILHCCTDNSLSIAKQLASENKNIKIYTYDYSISRAGYENLATDINSHHSLVHYYNYCAFYKLTLSHRKKQLLGHKTINRFM